MSVKSPEAVQMRATMFACFVAGWECSIEGWNGEYAKGDPERALRCEFETWLKEAREDIIADPLSVAVSGGKEADA